MPSTQVAKKRFQPNVPVKAGTLYKHTVQVGNQQKTYLVLAKYNKTLESFDPIWFENTTPKEYFFTRSQLVSTSFSLFPKDKLVVVDEKKSVTNDHKGFMEKPEVLVLVEDMVSTKAGSVSFTASDGTDRMRHVELRPFRCDNYEGTKYHQAGDQTFTYHLHLRNCVKQVYIFEVKELFTPVYPTSSTFHKVVVNFGSYTPSYQGTAPNTTGPSSATYSIPNELTKRKMTFTESGSTMIIKMENYV